VNAELLGKIGQSEPSLSHIEQYESGFAFGNSLGHFYAIGGVATIHSY
jgi:hypothetical protein